MRSRFVIPLAIILACAVGLIGLAASPRLSPELVLQRKLCSPDAGCVYAVCDQANGVMVYTYWGTSSRGGVAAVPNGCEKAAQ